MLFKDIDDVKTSDKQIQKNLRIHARQTKNQYVDKFEYESNMQVIYTDLDIVERKHHKLIDQVLQLENQLNVLYDNIFQLENAETTRLKRHEEKLALLLIKFGNTVIQSVH
jgi:hypothetical protein